MFLYLEGNGVGTLLACHDSSTHYVDGKLQIIQLYRGSRRTMPLMIRSKETKKNLKDKKSSKKSDWSIQKEKIKDGKQYNRNSQNKNNGRD